ncbi:MAG: putative peptidoglycan glycosyltransferase FtsW [Chlamydiales bacterium]|nr:putative peptidoglycan glycosyltransferase FtsW [Chlamydiales bacterium]
MRLLILICMTFIFALGLMMVFNTSSAEILDRSLDKSVHQALLRQIVYAFAGILIALMIWRVGYVHLLRFAPILLFLITLLLILVFVPGIGKVRNGAHRWVGVGAFTIQPSEFVKYLLPMAFINWITARTKLEVSFVDFCKMMGVIAFPMFLVLIEPDNGTTAVIGMTLLPLFFISGIRFKYWALPMLVLLTLGGLAAYQLPYVRGRLEVYLHPELDLKGKGHQPYQAKIAAGSGGLLGQGPGASLQKLTYLPEAQNDYIAAIYAEEFGFLGMLFLIILYMLFAFGGFSIAMRTKSLAGCYLATSITFLIALQAFLNLGVVSGLLPSKGVNLPFFSQGGTSLIANMIGLTLLLNIGKHEKENSLERRGNRRTLISSPKSC